MNKSSSDYNIYESRILEVMVLACRLLSTRQIAHCSDISYNTTKKYLAELHNKNKVKKIRKSNRIYWHI